jgi:hypothetical protein
MTCIVGTILVFSCRGNDVYDDAEKFSCRPTVFTDGNRCERWIWQDGLLKRWILNAGGGCDTADVYEFEYDGDRITAFRFLGAMPYSATVESDEFGRPLRWANSLGESVEWIYAGELIIRSVHILRDTAFETDYAYDAMGNAIRAGGTRFRYASGVKNMYRELPRAATLAVKGPEALGPNQRLAVVDAFGAESGYKAAVANAQGYPVQLITMDAGMFAVAYDCR